MGQVGRVGQVSQVSQVVKNVRLNSTQWASALRSATAWLSHITPWSPGAEASLAEVGYCLHVARRLEYISNETFGELELEVRKVGAPLSGLIDRLGQVRRV